MIARPCRTFLPWISALAVLALVAPDARAEDEEEDESQAPALPMRDGDWDSVRYGELAKELADIITSPRAAATIYKLGQLAHSLDSLAPLAQLLQRTADDARATGEVRVLARRLLADVELSRARLPRARAAYEKLALVTDGWLVGGFDNEGGSGHATPFPPELGPIDLRATYAGKEREIAWRRLPPQGPSVDVQVGDVLRPRRNATFYFLTSLESSSAQRGALFLGTSGATRLWVNGALAVDDDADHPARFDQRGVSVALRKGLNVVLLKVSGLDEVPQFNLRAALPNGRPLAGARWVAPAQEAIVTAVAPHAPGKGDVMADRPVPIEDTVAQLARLIAASPNDGSLRDDLGVVLGERRPFDTKTQRHRREEEKAAELLGNDARAWVRASSFVDDDHNVVRRHLERALAANPTYAPALVRLGRYYLDRGFARIAADQAEKALAAAPNYPPGYLLQAEALDALGLTARARRVELDAADRFPTTPDVVHAAARAERSLGRVHRAAERLRVLLALRYDDSEGRRDLTNVLVESGDLDGAAALLQKELELSPTGLSAGLRLARLYSQNGRGAEALAAYDRLVALAPDDDELVQARGKHRLRMGDEEGAVQDFQRALVLKPQNPQLRELLLSIRPQENFAEGYLRDAVALAREARAHPASADDDAVLLAEVNVVRVFPNGLSSRVHQQVTQVLTPRALERARVEGVGYSPGEQEVKIERARVVKPDGTVVESKNESDRDASDDRSGMYFDHRQRVVSFPNLEVGDVVEFTYRQDDVSSTNMFADYFGDVEFLQGTAPRRVVDYVLIAPARREFYANEPALKDVQHTVRALPDDRREWRWTATNVPKLQPEPRMPGWASVAAYLHVSTFREWNDVARFWWGLVKDQLHVTPEVAAAAEEAVKGVPAGDLRARVRAVYDAVVTKTRYVGLEFGIHGFKPYKVDRVLARRFGDCKDKASLMYAMLHHLGIDSRLVLLRMHNLGQLAPRPASLAVFNHAILYVPELDWFLDGTAEFSGSSEVPGADQAAQALLVEEDPKATSRFVLTPVSKADENTTRSENLITLAADGSARLKGSSVVKGVSAQGWRRAYESESGRRERFEQGYARSYPGARAVSFDITDPRAIEKPVETHFALDVPQLAQRDETGLNFSPFGEAFHYVESTAPTSTRTYVLDLGTPWRNEFSYVVVLPADAKLAEVPPPAEQSGPFGSFKYRVEKTPEGLRLTGHVSVSVSEVQPSDYPAFRAYLEEVDRTFSRRLRVAVPQSRPVQAAAETK